jgi:hypothetical protein
MTRKSMLKNSPRYKQFEKALGYLKKYKENAPDDEKVDSLIKAIESGELQLEQSQDVKEQP